jgi:hypothetical protein
MPHCPIARPQSVRTLCGQFFENVKDCPDSIGTGCMYIDFESWYSAYALVLPSRCAEAVKLSRLGHNREHTGCEVYPPSDVAGTQRDIRRHVRYRAAEGELRQLPRPSSDGSISERKSPFLTNGGEINWITVPARAAKWRSSVRRNLHGQRRTNRLKPIEAKRNASDATWRTVKLQ